MGGRLLTGGLLPGERMVFMIQYLIFIGLNFFILFGVNWGEASEKLYRVTGRLKSITSSEVLLGSDFNELRFEYSKGQLKLPEDAQVGERVTVWYTLDARRVEVLRNSGGNEIQPGKIDLDRLILDDRAFYEAKREGLSQIGA